MNLKLENTALKSPELAKIERISGEALSLCYQCGNCTAGCPVAKEMDVPPTQMIRMLQLGLAGEVERAASMWLCLGCLQCYSRCPKSVSAANIFEALRQMQLRSGTNAVEAKDLSAVFLKTAPQQAIVAGFRKLVG
jgi:heterodisulfide reductase subunit C